MRMPFVTAIVLTGIFASQFASRVSAAPVDDEINAAEALIKNGDLPQGLAKLDTLILTYPSNPGAYYARANARYKQWENKYFGSKNSESDEARRAMQPIINDCLTANRLNTTGDLVHVHDLLGTAYASIGDHRASFAVYDGIIRKYPKYKISTLFEGRASARRKLGDLQGAIADYTVVAGMNRDSYIVYYNRGTIYRDLKDYDRALADFRKGIDLLEAKQKTKGNDPVVTNLYIFCAEIRRARGDAAGADRELYEIAKSGTIGWVMLDKQIGPILDHVIAQNPNEIEAYDMRGAIRLLDSQFAKACDDFTKVLQLTTDDKLRCGTLVNRATCYRKLGNLDAALADAQAGLKLGPTTGLYESLANTYEKQGKWAQAAEAYSGAVGLAKPGTADHRRYLYDRAYAYRHIGQYEKARADLDEVIRQDPRHTKAYGARGLTLMMLKQDNQAIADLKQCRTLDSKYFSETIEPVMRKNLAARKNAPAEKPMDASMAAAAFRLGSGWTQAVGIHASAGKNAQVDTLLAIARREAAALGVQIPDLPTRTGIARDDLGNALRHLNQFSAELSDAIEKKHGLKVARHFDLTAKANTLLLAYDNISPKIKLMLAEGLERTGKESGLPEALWKDPVEKAKAPVPFKEYVAAVVEMHNKIAAHFNPTASR